MITFVCEQALAKNKAQEEEEECNLGHLNINPLNIISTIVFKLQDLPHHLELLVRPSALDYHRPRVPVPEKQCEKLKPVSQPEAWTHASNLSFKLCRRSRNRRWGGHTRSSLIDW